MPLTRDDFPTGKRCPQSNHNKVIRIGHLVIEHHEEYCKADKLSEVRQFRGRRMRSKSELLSLIVDEIKPPAGSHYKIMSRDGVTWVINASFNDKTLRTKITNAINKYLRSHPVPSDEDDASRENAAQTTPTYANAESTASLENTSPTSERSLEVSTELSLVSLSSSTLEEDVREIASMKDVNSNDATGYSLPSEEVGQDVFPHPPTNSTHYTDNSSSCDGSTMQLDEIQDDRPSSLIEKHGTFIHVIENIFVNGRSISSAEGPSDYSSMSWSNHSSAGGGLQLLRELHQRGLPSHSNQGRAIPDEGYAHQVADRVDTSHGTQSVISLTPTDMEFPVTGQNAEESIRDNQESTADRINQEANRLLSEIDRNAHNSNMLEYSLDRLLRIGVMDDDGLLDSNIRHEVVTIVTNILKTKLDDHGVVGIALGVLGSLTGLLNTAMPIGTVSAVVSVMDLPHQASALLQTAACKTLSTLAWYSSVNKMTITQTGGLKALVAVMQHHLNNCDIQKYGCRALAYMSADHISVEAAPTPEGGMKVKVKTTRGNPGDCNIQKYASHLLDQSVIDSEYSMSIYPAMIGAVEMVEAIIRGHCEHEQRILGLDDNSASKKVIETLVAAMRNHHDNSNIQRYGSCAFLNLALLSETHKSAVAEAGGIEAVVAAMQYHPAHSSIQENGCLALFTLTFKSPPNKRRVSAAGGIKAVESALQGHSDHSNIVGTGTLGHAYISPSSNQKTLAKEGGIAAMAAAMHLFPSDPDIQRYVCRAFCRLAFTYSSKLNAVDGVAGVVKAMQSHPANSDIQKYGCRCLAELAFVNPSNRALDGITAVIAAMRGHAHDAKIQEAGAYVLFQVAFANPSNRTALAAADGIGALVAAMQ